MTGGGGLDIFRYAVVAESVLQFSAGRIDVSGDDTLAGFQAGADRIDLSAFHFAGSQASVLVRSGSGFTADLTAATGFFGAAGVAVEYAGSAARV